MKYEVKEISQSLFQVHDQNGQMDSGVAGVGKTRHHAVQSVAPFGFTELALNRVSFSGLASFHQLLVLVKALVLGRSTQFWTVHLDSVLVAEVQVIPVSVDLVGQDSFRVDTFRSLYRLQLSIRV